MTSLAIGLGLPFIRASVYNFTNTEAATAIARMTVPPTYDQKRAYDVWFTAHKAIGLSKFLARYILATHDVQAAYLNLLSTSFTLVPASTPVFAALSGVTGDGIDDSLSTGIQPNTNGGGILTQNSAHLMVNVGNNLAANTTAAGCGGTFVLSIDPRRTDNLFLGIVTNTTNITATVATSVGQSMVTRTGSTTAEIRRDKTQVGTSSAASTGLPSGIINLLSRGGASAFSAARVRSASVGAGLTSGESDAVYDADAAFFAAVGAT
jgi:hypothetical protein